MADIILDFSAASHRGRDVAAPDNPSPAEQQVEGITEACVARHRAAVAPLASRMEIVWNEVVRTLALADGQRILVGSFDDVNDARKRIEALSEYWPGDYAIVRPHYEQGADQ